MPVLIRDAEKLVGDEKFEVLRNKKMKHGDSRTCNLCEKIDKLIDGEE